MKSIQKLSRCKRRHLFRAEVPLQPEGGIRVRYTVQPILHELRQVHTICQHSARHRAYIGYEIGRAHV